MKPTSLATTHRTSPPKSNIQAALSVSATMALAPPLFAADIGQTIKADIIGLDAHAVPWTRIIQHSKSILPGHPELFD